MRKRRLFKETILEFARFSIGLTGWTKVRIILIVGVVILVYVKKGE